MPKKLKRPYSGDANVTNPASNPLLSQAHFKVHDKKNKLLPNPPSCSYKLLPLVHSASMNRSKSCDQLINSVSEESGVKVQDKPGPLPAWKQQKDRPTQLVIVSPPVLPCHGLHDDVLPLHSLPLFPSSPSSSTSLSPQIRSSKPSSKQMSLGEVATDMSRSFPLQIEMLEGFMHNYMPNVTMSRLDTFNVHLLKQQEVILVRDSSGQEYSIPLHSSIQIGLISDGVGGGGGKKSNTLHKTLKAADIMAMKVLPKVMCATRTDRSRSGDKFSVEDKEILLVEGIKKVPGSRKKKVLEVFSVSKQIQKLLFPECTGHFSLSPSLTHLPISVLFKHRSQLCDQFPLAVFLFFKPEDLSNSSTLKNRQIPPASLAQDLVMVQDKFLEKSLIMSPHLENSSIDLRNSEHLINVVIDDKFGELEVLVKDISPVERKKLYHDTCLVHETIDFSKVKFYFESVSRQVHNTQTYIYGKCQSKLRTGVKMDLPPWTSSPNRSSNVSTLTSKTSKKTEQQDLCDTTSDIVKITRKVSDSCKSEKEVFSRDKEEMPSCKMETRGKDDNTTLESSSSSISTSHISPSNSLSSTATAFTMAIKLEDHTPEQHSDNIVYPVNTQSVHASSTHSSPFTCHTPCTTNSGGGLPPKTSPRLVKKRDSITKPCVTTTSNRPPYPTSTTLLSPHVLDSASSSKPDGRKCSDVYQSGHQVSSSFSCIDTTTSSKDDKSVHSSGFTGDTHALQVPLLPSSSSSPPPLLLSPPLPTSYSLSPPPLLSSPPHSPVIPCRNILRACPFNFESGSAVTQARPAMMSNTNEAIPPSEATYCNSKTARKQSRLQFHSGPTKFKQPHSRSSQYHSELNAANMPLPRKPPPSQPEWENASCKDNNEDDTYEDMRSYMRSKPYQDVVKPPLVSQKKGEGLLPSTTQSRLASDVYEIFNPPTRISVMQGLNTQVKSLTKQVMELSQLPLKLEALQASTDKVLERVCILEDRMMEIAKPKRDSMESSEAQKNITCLQKLSCNQLKQVLNGLNIGDYNALIDQEVVNGDVFVALDESILENELGITSPLCRLKMLKLIGGSYDPNTYLLDSSSM